MLIRRAELRVARVCVDPVPHPDEAAGADFTSQPGVVPAGCDGVTAKKEGYVGRRLQMHA